MCLSKKFAFSLLLIVLAFTLSAATKKASFKLPKKLDSHMNNYCYSCHDDETQKGDVRLDNLASLKLEKRLDLLNKIQEQLYFKQMPPKKKKKRPSDSNRQEMLINISSELYKHRASTLEGKLEKPEYGNFVDHEKLFGGEFKDLPGFTYDRRWLISEFIFNDKFHRMMQSRAKPGSGSRVHRMTLTNPFLLPETIGVRYYANVDLTGGHLSTMLTNAQKTSAYITDELAKKNKKYLPAISQIMELENKHNATLASRKKFLENFIAKLCSEYYGKKHETMLPTFLKVKINPLKKLEKGEKYKKAPIHVAINMLKGLEGDYTVFRSLQNPDIAKLSDKEFSQYCEKTWFYFGHHERKIQGRVTVVRDYLTTFRKDLDKYKKKYKPVAYKALSDSEMAIIKASI
jgi:hypothetical protein